MADAHLAAFSAQVRPCAAANARAVRVVRVRLKSHIFFVSDSELLRVALDPARKHFGTGLQMTSEH